MHMDYIRLAKGGFSNYEMVPADSEIYELINKDEPNYQSLYKYTDEHYKFWKENNIYTQVRR